MSSQNKGESRHCPECAIPLEEHSFQGVHAHQCPRCQGTWLEAAAFHDAGEKLAPELAWLDFDVWRDIERFQAAPTLRPCPSCRSALVELRHGHSRHTLDYCDDCSGVWIARDSFLEIVDALREEVAAMSSGDVLEASLRQAGHLLTHPGSALSEWKDLTHLLRLLEVRVLTEHPALRALVLGVQRGNPFD